MNNPICEGKDIYFIQVVYKNLRSVLTITIVEGEEHRRQEIIDEVKQDWDVDEYRIKGETESV